MLCLSIYIYKYISDRSAHVHLAGSSLAEVGIRTLDWKTVLNSTNQTCEPQIPPPPPLIFVVSLNATLVAECS